MLFFRPYVISIIPIHNEKGEELSQNEREKKACKIEKHLYDATYFLASSIIAYYFCIGADWSPWYMGGPGDLNKYLNTSNLPFSKLHPDVPAWGFLMLGYRFEALFTTIFFARHQTDFLEMLLHDIVTIALYLGFLFGYLT